MATHIYTVTCDDCIEGEYALPTLAAAREFRRNTGDADATITKIEIANISRRDLLCSIFNREGYAASQTDVT